MKKVISIYEKDDAIQYDGWFPKYPDIVLIVYKDGSGCHVSNLKNKKAQAPIEITDNERDLEVIMANIKDSKFR